MMMRQSPSSSRRMSFHMSGWTLMRNSTGLYSSCHSTHQQTSRGFVSQQQCDKYLLVYLLCDGLQLADVFESFCKHIKHTHNVNPLFFYGAPGLSFSAMLYQFRDSDVHPVMLSEPNMAGFFTQMIRGGTLRTSAQDMQRQVRMRASSILMQTTSMDGQCHRNCHMEGSGGWNRLNSWN